MINSQFSKCNDFELEDLAKTQVFQYLHNQTLFSLQNKKNHLLCLKDYPITKYSFETHI